MVNDVASFASLLVYFLLLLRCEYQHFVGSILGNDERYAQR
jgi:hypothetical protein